jgi:hypothetical protein
MHELRTDIDIAASPEDTWAVLTDFAAYSQWNPFIRRVYGAPTEGSPLEVFMYPPGARGGKFRLTVVAAHAPHELCWRGFLLLPGVLAGEHRFLIEPLPGGGVRFEQSERFSGLLTPLLRATIERNVCRGFREMNAALKGRVERRCNGSASRTI